MFTAKEILYLHQIKFRKAFKYFMVQLPEIKLESRCKRVHWVPLYTQKTGSLFLEYWAQRAASFFQAFIHPQTGLDHDNKPCCGPHCTVFSAVKLAHISPGAAVYMTSNWAPSSCLLEVWLLVRSACMDLSLIRHVWQSVQQASTKWKSKHWMASNPSLQESQTFNHK